MAFGVFESSNRGLSVEVDLSETFTFRVGSAKEMISAAVIAMKAVLEIAEFERNITA